MSTPCCRVSTAYRIVVSEYEVPKVLVSQECQLFFGTPCSTAAHVKDDPKKSAISITYCRCDMGIPQPLKSDTFLAGYLNYSYALHCHITVLFATETL